MRILFLVLGLLVPAIVMADDSDLIGGFGRNNGSLPPEYAWEYWVEIHADRALVIRYCRGYADEPPGCGIVTDTVTEAAMATLLERIDEIGPSLVADPPRENPDPPIGGGSSYGKIFVDGTEVKLPAFPRAGDAVQVDEALQVLVDAVPVTLIERAARKARPPKG